ncbi:hypothetical protein ABZX93_16350 [Streptomyces sp. NPDC006632]|uniref:hypothetical protein n=1 Tax=Streptomyces sp. NPDC006632 TaxID=3157182 RepID=UPI0033B05093
MIVINLGPEQRVDPADDDLGRDRIGYSSTMSPIALYDAGHGAWHLGERAHKERFALMIFDGAGVLAVEIDRIEPVPTGTGGRASGRRSVIHGEILAAGHPVHDAHVGKPSPIPPQRNPIGYYDAAAEQVSCLCGCGEKIPAGKDFVQGHDQTAVRDRVSQIGTVRDFIEWFDRAHGAWPDINVIHEPVTLDGTATGAPARMRHRLGCDHFPVDESGRVLNTARAATRRELETLRPCKHCVSTSAKAARER